MKPKDIYALMFPLIAIIVFVAAFFGVSALLTENADQINPRIAPFYIAP